MIREVHRVLRPGGKYMVICNGGIGREVLEATFAQVESEARRTDSSGPRKLMPQRESLKVVECVFFFFFAVAGTCLTMAENGGVMVHIGSK